MDRNTLVDPAAGCTLARAKAINDRAQIVSGRSHSQPMVAIRWAMNFATSACSYGVGWASSANM